MGAQKVLKVAQKNKFSWEVDKFAGKIRIDLTIIFRMNDFLNAILSFGHMVDFVLFPS